MKRVLVLPFLLFSILGASAQDKTNLSNFFSEHGKVTYLVSNDNEAETSNLLDVLQKYPYIAIDEKGVVTLNGSPDFGLIIDGQPLDVQASLLCSILRNMPARFIEKVEVNTQPSASLLISCSAGVINVVTKKNKPDGVAVSIGGRANSNGYFGGDLLFNFKKKKVNLNASFSTGVDNSVPVYQETIDSYSNLITKNKSLYYLNPENDNHLNLNGSWQISTNNLLSFSLNKYHEKNLINSKSYYNDSNTKKELDYPNNYINLNAKYNHIFINSGAKLSLLFSYENNSLNFSNTYNSSNAVYSYMNKQNNNFDDKNYYFGADFVLPIGDCHKIEFGGKILKSNLEIIDIYQMINKKSSYDEKSYSELSASYNSFLVNNVRWNSYFQYDLKLDKFQLTSAIRTEETPDYSYIINNKKINLLPSINMSYQLSNSTSLFADYGMYLSSKYWQSDEGMLSSQSDMICPNLFTDKKNNKIHLGFSSNSSKLSLLFDAFYSFGNDGISKTNLVMPLGANNSQTINSIQENCSFNRTNLSFVLGYQVIPALKIQLSSGIGYYDQTFLKHKKTGFDGYSVLSTYCDLPYGFLLNANAGYYFPRFLADGDSSENSFYRFRISRNLFKNKLLLALYANNFANTNSRLITNPYIISQKDKTLNKQTFYKETGHEVGVSIVFRFF